MAWQTIDSSKDGRAVANYASPLTYSRCSKCTWPISTSKADVTRFCGIGGESAAACLHCETTTCLGCRETLKPDTPRLGRTRVEGIVLTWHCDAGRLALIWALLCGYDDLVKHNKQAAPPAKPPPKHKPLGKRRGPNGVGYSLDADYSYDAFANEAALDLIDADYYGSPVPPSAKVRASRYKRPSSPARVDPDDEITRKTMSSIAALLPSPNQMSAFDKQPPSIVSSFFLRSSILDKAAELLRNNSLEDVTRRFSLYTSLLSFLHALARGSLPTLELLHQPRPLNKLGHDLSKLSYQLPTRLANEPEEFGQPLAACMQGLKEQSEMLVSKAAAHPEEFQGDEEQRLLTLCTNIKDCAGVILKENASMQDHGKATAESDPDPYAWQKDIAVLPVDGDAMLKQHYYAKEAVEFTDAKVGRMRQLFKEITLLKTSLPANIFVRYPESRPDLMKVIIVGPEDTPYENGLFEFDLLCPLNYPNEPPKMHLRTTGGGRVGFNPNLYNSGKVCLSLLGTWQGETWQPGKSTILQVLVSIQGMVFCPEPWCNEPGRHGMDGTDESKGYNRRLHPDVVKYAMLEWIDGKKTPDRFSYRWSSTSEQQWSVPPKQPTTSDDGIDVFQDVAKQHFERNRVAIITKVRSWVTAKLAYDEERARMPPKRKKRKSVSLPTHPYQKPVTLQKEQHVQPLCSPKDAVLRDELVRCLEEMGGHVGERRLTAEYSDFSHGGGASTMYPSINDSFGPEPDYSYAASGSEFLLAAPHVPPPHAPLPPTGGYVSMNPPPPGLPAQGYPHAHLSDPFKYTTHWSDLHTFNYGSQIPQYSVPPPPHPSHTQPFSTLGPPTVPEGWYQGPAGSVSGTSGGIPSTSSLPLWPYTGVPTGMPAPSGASGGSVNPSNAGYQQSWHAIGNGGQAALDPHIPGNFSSFTLSNHNEPNAGQPQAMPGSYWAFHDQQQFDDPKQIDDMLATYQTPQHDDWNPSVQPGKHPNMEYFSFPSTKKTETKRAPGPQGNPPSTWGKYFGSKGNGKGGGGGGGGEDGRGGGAKKTARW